MYYAPRENNSLLFFADSEKCSGVTEKWPDFVCHIFEFPADALIKCQVLSFPQQTALTDGKFILLAASSLYPL